MPYCYVLGVWGASHVVGERSRHMRGGAAVLGSSGKVAGLAVRFLAHVT